MSAHDTKLAILKSALEAFSQRGYLGAPTKEIAKAAGVSEMTLFRHFGSKQLLFEAVFATFVFRPSFAKIGADLEGSLLEVLTTFSSRFVESLKKNKHILTMLLQDLPRMREHGDPMTKYRVQLKDLLAERLAKLKQEGGFEGDAEAVAVTFVSSLFGVFLGLGVLEAFGPDAKLDTAVDELVRCFAAAHRG